MSQPITFSNSVRYSTLALCAFLTLLALFTLVAFGRGLLWLLRSCAHAEAPVFSPLGAFPCLQPLWRPPWSFRSNN